MYGFCDDHSDSKIAHAAVMNGYKYQDEELTLMVRNSLSGQKLNYIWDSDAFGDEVQDGEHTIEGKTTRKNNEWNLGHEECYYFEFHSENKKRTNEEEKDENQRKFSKH